MTETAFVANIILSLAAFSALAFSVWCVPTLAIKFFQFVSNYKDPSGPVQNQQVKLCLFKQLIYVYNGLDDKDTSNNQLDSVPCISTAKKRLQIAMRYFAIAPWVLFILTCVRIFFNDVYYVWGLVAAVFVILYALIWLIDRNKDKITEFISKKNAGNFNRVRFTLFTIIIPAAIIISWVMFFIVKDDGDKVEYRLMKEYLMIVFHTLVLLAFYCFIIYMENEKFKKETAYKISNDSYKSVIIFLALCIVWFYFFNEKQLIEYISPINIIIIISTILIIFFEFFFTSQHLLINIIERLCKEKAPCLLIPEKSETRRLRGYKYLLFALLFILVYQFFFSSINEHRIRVEDSVAKVHGQRTSLNLYFDRWLKSRKQPGDSVVYLISGQGGGSRAAAHFFMSMAMFEKRDSGFFDRVFCISTASGSSSGAEMYLASKYYGYPFKDSLDIRDKGIQLYGKNYMSSAFFGLLMGDGIEYFTSGSNLSTHDRNYHLQKEEMAGFNKTHDKVGNQFFERDYMFPYADTTRHWPLFMINTTVVDYGVRGIFSPVINNFSLARDLYGEFAKDNSNDKRDLPLVACVNQSQAFPLLSAYNYMECTGRMADGGVVENTGCATTLDVYEALRMYLHNTGRDRIRIICINLYNSSLRENFYAPFKKASILNTVTAVINSPFDGAQFYAYKNLSKKIAYLDSLNPGINHRDTVMDFGLDTAVTLTRTLSKQSVEKIFKSITDSTRSRPIPRN
jgi:hypothetical protein